MGSHDFRDVVRRSRVGPGRAPSAIPAIAASILTVLGSVPAAHADGPSKLLDLATVSTSSGILHRVYGSTGAGFRGLPVAGGLDCDGDGAPDYAMAAMLASPLGRSGAGEVYLIFGDGTIGGFLDTATTQSRILRIAGDGASEAAGSELWMDDVTGDGLGDLLIARQNYTPTGSRTGAGALTILVGGAALRAYAATLQRLDLRTPPTSLTVVTFVGAAAFDRLGIWMRTGDVTGDGVADIVVGADQAAGTGETHSGSVYVIRGGTHLATSQTIDLAGFGATPLAGHIARVVPPDGAAHYHFGATCQIADLDGNQRAEVLVGAALNRAGAGILADGAPPGSAHAIGGAPLGRVYVLWDDNFTGNPWAAGLSFAVSSSPGSRTIISGGTGNVSFGEELLGGLDFDGDGARDLFVGDIVGDGSAEQNRPASGTGYVFYAAQTLKGLEFSLNSPPPGLVTTTFIGGAIGDIASDTAAQGDFDNDGHDDLAFSSPDASPLGRSTAGILHVFHGRQGVWPAQIDLKVGQLPPPSQIRITQFYGAKGTTLGNNGDTLCYSAAAGDIDGDGTVDIITNEMQGDGLGPGTTDDGNLIILSGAATRAPGVVGTVRYYASQNPVPGVTVRLLQSGEVSTTTNGEGGFALAPEEAGGALLLPSKSGEERQGISSLDAAHVSQAIVGLRSFDALQTLACDVTGNGTLSSLDAARIQQLEVGLIQSFPVSELCGQSWAFVPKPDLVANQTLTQPVTGGGMCQNGSISYTPLAPPVGGQDFVAVLFGDCTGNWE
jgi:hypothetical protein